MAEPSFLRRLLLCRFDLCDLWYRKEEYGRTGYACAGCDRTSMMREPPRPPSGGTSASKAVYRQEPVPACTIAPSLDSLHLAFEEPVIGYLSKTGYRLFREEPDWHTKLCRDQAELNAKGGVVEVEIRVRRVIQR